MSHPTATCKLIDKSTGYLDLEETVKHRAYSAKGKPIFTTDATGLWEMYLADIPALHRQHYNCHACRRFIERYGGIVTINESGLITPLLWGCGGMADAMYHAVLRSRVTGVFLSSDKVWGIPVTGLWTHLSGVNPNIFHHALLTDSQMMAEKAEDYATLRRGLAEYPKEAVVQAVRVLEADAVDRSEKTLGIAQWLLDLHTRLESLKGKQRDNVVWLAVAQAPVGWCHIRTTMIATLLDDIVYGYPFETIKRRWNEKMHPLQYQRPTTLSEGNVTQANKIVAKLGSEGSLARRYATLDDVILFEWRPQSVAPKSAKGSGGAFDHLLPNRIPQVREVNLPAKRITWEKFKSEVLPHALEISVLTPIGRSSFYGLVTAVNADAPPMLQWDSLEIRNPVSWYFRYGGSLAREWGLVGGAWVKVSAIFRKPPFWTSPATHFDDTPLFALEGAKEMSTIRGGGLFPECLRSEYHSIRKAIEAHSQSATVEGAELGTANGIALDKNQPLRLAVRTASVGCQEYDVTVS